MYIYIYIYIYVHTLYIYYIKDKKKFIYLLHALFEYCAFYFVAVLDTFFVFIYVTSYEL